MAWKFRIPDFLDRYADEQEQESDGDDPNDDEASNDECPLLEIRKTKYPVVHQKETDLRPYKVEDVEDLSDEEIFCHHDNVWNRNVFGVLSHAVFDHSEDESNYQQIPALQCDGQNKSLSWFTKGWHS